MAIGLAPIFKKAYISLAVLGGVYVLFVACLTIPGVQRNALYAHRINPTFWQNLSNVEAFGFLRHQVQPFTVLTPDNETLYAWHIVPVHLVHEHNPRFLSQPDFDPISASQVLETTAFQLLASHPNAHVILNFHGNAGHLASSYRPTTYQRFLNLSTPSRPVHVIAFDYRGFGLSTAQNQPLNPSSHLSIPPSRIFLTSQSLGTAVSTAVFHRWTIIHKYPPPKLLLLTSGFSSFISLIDSYSIKGIIPPLLSPFRAYPFIMARITAHIADTWRTDLRLREIILGRDDRDNNVPANNIPAEDSVNIEIIHAHDDMEIPWWEGQHLWDAVVADIDTTSTSPSKPPIPNPNPPKPKISSTYACDSTFSHTLKIRPPSRNPLPAPPAPLPPPLPDQENVPNQDILDLDTDEEDEDEIDQPIEPGSKILRFSVVSSGGHNRVAFSDEVLGALGRALERRDMRFEI